MTTILGEGLDAKRGGLAGAAGRLGQAATVLERQQPAPAPFDVPAGAPVPVQPIQPPQGPPVQPLLQHTGYTGTIQQFNARVQATVQAHTQATGTIPSPGLTLSVAASRVPDEQIPHLFTAPQTSLQARTARVARQAETDAAAARAKSPYDYIYERSDGLHQFDNPVRGLVQTEQQAQFATTQGGPVSSAPPEPLSQRYPWVAMGALPVANLDGVYSALRYLNEQGGKDFQVISQGQDLATFQKEAAAARTGDAGLYQTLADRPQYGATLEPKVAAEMRARTHIATIADAQRELNKEMGTTLPVTGFFDQEWAKTLSSWTKSADYFRRQTAYQAQQAGYGNDVDAYEKAWRSKQDAVRGNGLWSHFLSLMPLQLFGHSGPLGVTEGLWGYVSQGKSPLDVTFYSPTTALHGLTRSAGLTLNVVGGTVEQLKADLAAGNEFAKTLAPRALGGKGETLEQAKESAARTLAENPSWVRAFAPDAPESAVDSVAGRIANLAGDLVLLGKPSFTGERVAAGSVETAQKSRYLRAAARWAYNDLAAYGKNGVGRAAARLEGGQGAKALVARVAPLVQRGTLSPEQFEQHVAELYATGRTNVAVRGATAEVHGPLLASLRTDKLPAPGTGGRAWLAAKTGLRKTLDAFDMGARQSSVVGTDTAANLVGTLRSAVAHAAPRGPRGFFDETLPENVFNFVMRHRLGDTPAETANRLESQLVRFQGTENVRGIQAVQRKLQALYHDRYPLSDTAAKDDPFEATLATEAPSVFRFPGGGEQEVTNALGTLSHSVSSVNRTLNRLAMLHARIILSGFPVPGGGLSLFWKHAIGDTLRTEVGGGGILTGANPEVRAAKAEIDALANTDPTLSRKLGTFRARAVLGETRWLLDRGGHTFKTTFSTGDPQYQRANYLDAAGGYLRRLLDDDALAAYQTGNPQDLVDLILHNRTYRGMWKSARSKARAQGQYVQAEDYADAVAARFKDAEDALAARNLTLDDAKAVLQGSRGAKADHALGQWLKDQGIDMEVKSALVEPRGTFDELTGRYIGNVVMKPNKLNRGRFADNVLADTYSKMRAAGLDPADALDVSIDTAARLTKYHMLDFANRLQVEQDLRWLSYFATKHRLYWKWLLGTFLRNPKYAAVVDDFRQNLDDHGNLGHWQVGGIGFTIPAARLVWVPGKDYSEVSPPALFVLGVVKSGGDLSAGFKAAGGTFGNVVTRSDTAIRMGARLASMAAGKTPATYGAATAGLDARTVARINRAINEYQTSFYDAHGHYAPEPDAVKHVLWAQTAEELWRSNLPLPVVPDNIDQRTVEQKQMAEYMLLLTPKDRRDYLGKHPGVADLFGVYDDPKKYLHNRDLFGRYTTALDAYRSARQHLYEQAQAEGMTPELTLDKRKLDAAFQKTFDGLLVEDAKFAGVRTAGRVPDGVDVPYGPWGKLAAADPQLDPRHALNALFPKLARSEDFRVYGVLQRQLERELGLLNDPKYAATFDTPDEVKTRKREILSQLDVFRRYPTDALGKVQLDYQRKYVDPYWKKLEARYLTIAKLPKVEKDQAYAELRAWKDGQDKPVTVPLPAEPAVYTLAGAHAGLVKPGNLDLNDRPRVRNADGTVSTVRTISIGIGTDAGEVLIPTVVGRRVVSDEQAIEHYKRTGENFGTFKDVAAANRYARALHAQQARSLSRPQGIVFPPPLEMAWATLDPTTRAQRLRTLAAGTWDHLADYEKKLLGHDPGPNISEGWLALDRFYQAAHDNAPPGTRIPTSYKQTLARHIDRYVKGFYKDWLFAQQPRYQRLERLSVIRDSPHRAEWNQLLHAAGAYYTAYVKSPGHTGVSEAWHRYVQASLQPAVDADPGFAAEVAQYGPDLLNTLIN